MTKPTTTNAIAGEQSLDDAERGQRGVFELEEDPARVEEEARQAAIQKAITPPEAPAPEPNPARERELKRQRDVEQAVHDATHNEDGTPKALGVADHLQAPAGITIVEGKP